jgi:YVTN family beta-propeller protein
VLTTIPVGINPNKVIYDPDESELFVCNSGYNTVSVISDSTNAVVATIRVGISPAGAAYDSGKGEVFVANYGSGVNTVSVISDTNYAVVATVPVGTTPYGVAYNSVTNEIYVSNHGSNSVSVISDSSNAVVATIPVGNTPAGITYDFGKGEMFVASMGDKTVSVISDATTVFTSPTPSNSSSPTPGATSIPNPSSSPLNSSDLMQQVWVPSPTGAVEAVTVTAIAVGVISLIFAALSNPLGNAGGKVGEKTKGLVPENIKNWLEEFVSSRRKLEIAGKTGSPFLPTKTEAIAYTTAIIVLAISFSYVKVITLNQIWALLPVFFATSVLVGFVQKFFAIAFMRSRGVWSEHKIWPFGLVLFLFTTFVFRVPFSSPTRSVNQSSKFTERLGAIVSASGILICLAFAGIFFLLLKEGYVAIGGAGLDMCVIGSFFGTFPVSPMSGKDIFDHNKPLWAGLFIATLMIFAAWLLLI